MRKITWFVAGTVAGASGAGYAKRKVSRSVQRTAERLSPVNLARRANTGVRQRTARVVEGARQRGGNLGRQVSLRRADRRGLLERLEQQVNPGDEVLVDGRPVEAHRVVVVRQQSA